MSLARTIRHIRSAGLKKFWRDLQYIGDAKAGTLMGTDTMGNKYYEDLDEIPGRTRWVDYKNHDFSTNQLEPLWHSWLHHIRDLPPTEDPIVAASRKTWEAGGNAGKFLLKWLWASSYSNPTAMSDLVSARSLYHASTKDGFVEKEHQDSTTGTRGSYRAYSTTISPKIQSWDPSVKPRK